MTHTFKSLLITTVLTLPSAFGAAELHVTAAAAGPHSAELAAVAVARHLVATPEYIFDAASGMYDLGPSFYLRVAELLEKSANLPTATPVNIQNAVRGLRSIAAKYVEGSSERARYNALADAISAK